MTFNQAAHRQRHSPAFNGPYAERGDRFLCPCCGHILSRQWYVDIFGFEPENNPTRYGYRDPSDEAGYNVEYRSPR